MKATQIKKNAKSAHCSWCGETVRLSSNGAFMPHGTQGKSACIGVGRSPILLGNYQYVHGVDIERVYGTNLALCPFCDTEEKPDAVIEEDMEDPGVNIVSLACEYCGAEAGWTGWGTFESGFETKAEAILEAARCWNRRRGSNTVSSTR